MRLLRARRDVIVAARLLWLVGAGGLGAIRAQDFSVVESTIPQMQSALSEGRTTSRELVTQSLVRIAIYGKTLNPVLSVNAHALAEADLLDHERAVGIVRGPLHGIPIALKDNIQANGMPTTGGALAFDGMIAPYEATLSAHLRAAGAILIAKTVMTELANWVVLGMPNNYSSLGGQSFNPYDPRRDPRPGLNDGRAVLPTGSSSSGAGTAASLWAANIGTETTISIVGPASANMLAAIKPTLGRVSRYGVIPVSLDQDSPGPMARTVTDAAIVLGVLEGAAPDPHDRITGRCKAPRGHDYTQFLHADGLKGARIGVPRAWFIDAYLLPANDQPTGGIPPDQQQMMKEVIATLKAAGATVVDPADLPSVIAKKPEQNVLTKELCHAKGDVREHDAHCSVVLKYSFKRDFNSWLLGLGTATPIKTLADLRAWNVAHESAGSLRYGQDLLDISDAEDLQRDRARYAADRAREVRLAGAEGIDAVLKRDRLDALIFAGSRGGSVVAKAGYPTVIVPFGMVANGVGFPPDFHPQPAPLGVSFSGTACSEPRLLKLAYSFEQATARRRPPTF